MLHISQWLLIIIAIVYVVLAFIYSVVTPIFEASDELWHYPMVDFLANNQFRLPLQNASDVGRWRQEGSQPPLYYMLSALLVAGIDRSDLDLVRVQNPHADIGVVMPDGNANMMIHNPERESFPWQKTVLAVHVVRFFSIVLGLMTILVTYQIAREVFPIHPYVAVSAAAFNALLPMFLFISASVNNDNLSNLLGNLLTLLTVRLLKTSSLPRLRSYAVMGTVLGCGLLAKLNLVFWIPVLAAVFLFISIRFKSARPILVGGIVSGAITLLIAGWWYWRNWQLYSDPTGLNVFLDIVGRRPIRASAIELWSERHSFTQSFWGLFGGMNVPMNSLIYDLLNVIGVVGLLGALAFLIWHVVKRTFAMERWLIAAVPLVWPVVTFSSYLRWTAETPASQGRLIFGTLSSICLWMVVGWVWWLPKPVRLLPIAIVISLMFVIASFAPFAFIAPAYVLPEPTENDERNVIAQYSEPQSDGQIGLNDAQIITETVRPEGYVEILTTWRVDEQVQQNWSLFSHLVTTDGVIVGQRDIYPGQGRLATSNLSQGRAWENRIAIRVPSAAYSPATLDVQIGWYSLVTGERMLLPNGATTFTIGQVELLPRIDDLNVPNPLRVNFDNQIELVGYELSTLTPQAGETVDLTLFWRRLRVIEDDYTVFAHILNPNNLTIYGQSNSQPAGGRIPTSTWDDQEIIADLHQLQVAEETPPRIYELEIGLYSQTPDGGFQRLRLITPSGTTANDFTYLSRLRTFPDVTS